ncbi:hypothetical protein HPB49_006157 [Dermacentor silvarum]|uniref:Uncharacterized protein n=1 Tax=Dermacentor silvarum TaxID=543639 RepID=A0ACB8DW49_DERSI|nr:hypothetical protein HPB49_006157 [Dermacentor silvarum]
MATAQCSIGVFEQLDDATRVEAYRTAVFEAGALRTKVDQLRRELEGLKIMFAEEQNTAKEVDAPKPSLDPQLQASHDFICNLLAPIVECIERLESKTREDSDAESCKNKAKKHFFDKNFEKLDDMIDSFLRFDQISNSQENVKVLVAVEPPTPQIVERPILVKRLSRKSMRNRQHKESIEPQRISYHRKTCLKRNMQT